MFRNHLFVKQNSKWRILSDLLLFISKQDESDDENVSQMKTGIDDCNVIMIMHLCF